MIIDGNSMVRERLAQRLATIPGFDVIGATGDVEEGIQQMENLVPSLVLMDSKIAQVIGQEICRRASLALDGPKIVVLMGIGSEAEIRKAEQIGAMGYLLKDIGTQKLARDLRRLAGF